jgi:hypothetical protein
VDQVGSLQKIPTQLHLANLCVNGTSSVHFAPTFVLPQNSPKRPKTRVLGPMGVDRVRSLRKIPMQLHQANLCINGTISASFAPTLMQ